MAVLRIQSCLGKGYKGEGCLVWQVHLLLWCENNYLDFMESNDQIVHIMDNFYESLRKGPQLMMLTIVKVELPEL